MLNLSPARCIYIYTSPESRPMVCLEWRGLVEPVFICLKQVAEFQRICLSDWQRSQENVACLSRWEMATGVRESNSARQRPRVARNHGVSLAAVRPWQPCDLNLVWQISALDLSLNRWMEIPSFRKVTIICGNQLVFLHTVTLR